MLKIRLIGELLYTNTSIPRIHNNNAINLFQYLIELKNKLKIEHYIYASNSIGKFEKFLFLYEQL